MSRPTRATTTLLDLNLSSRVRLTCRANNGPGTEWERRRAAAHRQPAFGFCGCRDPWPCRCRQPVVESENQTDAWAAAARHLRALGVLPLLPVEAVRALWRRGGADRELAVSVRVEVEGRP